MTRTFSNFRDGSGSRGNFGNPGFGGTGRRPLAPTGGAGAGVSGGVADLVDETAERGARLAADESVGDEVAPPDDAAAVRAGDDDVAAARRGLVLVVLGEELREGPGDDDAAAPAPASAPEAADMTAYDDDASEAPALTRDDGAAADMGAYEDDGSEAPAADPSAPGAPAEVPEDDLGLRRRRAHSKEYAAAVHRAREVRAAA